ncbi:MAG: hypothetical protein RR601_03645 [Erysipelotrichales bacterium]
MLTSEKLIKDITKLIEKQDLEIGDTFWLSTENYNGYTLKRLRTLLQPLFDEEAIKKSSSKLSAPQAEQYQIMKYPFLKNHE